MESKEKLRKEQIHEGNRLLFKEGWDRGVEEGKEEGRLSAFKEMADWAKREGITANEHWAVSNKSECYAGQFNAFTRVKMFAEAKIKEGKK